ncbi:hypothetical protein [Butyrivibrio sp. VCB2006]|uniref:hypothetical protein n=1 Tax=Butyrivibrio sp. VCB2006 TaxID=1280679 RepID=UPI00041FA01C|nr:hypothetical protein [Butyrivibrio sp. VCB2006]
MKKKVLFATLIVAAMLAGCGSTEPKISEEAQAVIDRIEALGEITYDDKKEVESLFEAYDALTEEQKAEVTNYDQLREAKKSIHDYWMKNPFCLFGTDWDYAYTVTCDTLGITSEEYEKKDYSFGSSNRYEAKFRHPAIKDDDFTSLTFQYDDNKLSEVWIYDIEGAKKVDKYRELFEDYYGECYVHTDENNGFMWLADNCTVILDAYPSDNNDKSLSIWFYPPCKDDIDKQLAEAKYNNLTTTHELMSTEELSNLADQLMKSIESK